MRHIFTITCILLVVAAAPAQADPVELTAQAKAARAEFLLRVAPPSTPAAICLVDTGVNVNPDTSGVVGRLSMQGLDGLDRSPTLHGTQMTMLMGGQSNGFGMVGLWPHARIFSAQMNQPGEDRFEIGGYLHGMRQCDVLSSLHGIKVIVVALSAELSPSAEDALELADAVLTARTHGLNVVVASGNNSGRPPGTPANVAGAFSVGAVDAASGQLCASSSTGSLLLAPGCGIDGADPVTGQATLAQSGTSAAAAIAGVAIAALRTWRPDLTPDQAEQILNETGVASPDGKRLDLAAAFVAAGLQAVVSPPAAAPAPTPAPPAKPRLAKPRLTVRPSGRGAKRTLNIRASNRPSKTTLTIRVYRSAGKGKYRRIATKTVRSSKLKVRVSRRWARVSGRFNDPTGARLQSPATVVYSRR